ncbi:MAG: isoprenylcysteine carboxylmethyltransferase family protein [Clostridiales bacterium]|jgi:protein-S-isoprenylcysteine O-methyltransferase Ste14|nr:isoprenylcysteine carboxylmethyltransferase family protein [Clostridiales bacterium]
MSAKLFLQAIIKFLAGVVMVGALIFLPAWSFAYVEGWIFMGILFIPMFVAGIVMMFKSPDLLKSRLSAKETEKEQKLVIGLSLLMFIGAFVVAGLNFRFKWLEMPFWSVILAACIFIAAYIFYAEVLRENAYLSRTIEVQEGQKVVDTGLYGVVRHPMYMVTLVLFLSMPFVLGSLFSFFIMLVYIPIIVVRIINEEKFLEKELNGYTEYKKKVKYRLIPFIW